MGKFKKGDWVKLVDISWLAHLPELKVGGVYKVFMFCEWDIGQPLILENIPNYKILSDRFELASDADVLASIGMPFPPHPSSDLPAPAPQIVDRKPEKITKHALLDLAKQATADRGLSYGKPEDNFARIAHRWSAYLSERTGLKIELNAADVSLMMIDMKLARLEHKPDHLDSWIDVSGYAACGANITCDEPGKK